MKITHPLLAISSLISAASVSAFVLSPQSNGKTVSSSTKLYISSWGAGGPPSRRKEKPVSPEDNIQTYLKAPEPVAARPNLDGKVLVSGWVNCKERTDQTVFDFLNHEESAFRFEKIVAFVDDSKFAKKRLISRSARYTGLLDKLDFVQADTEGALPTLAQLEGIKSWVVNAGSDLQIVKDVAELVKQSSVENVSVLVTDAQSLTDASSAMDAAKAFDLPEGKAFTIVAVGAITEAPEGGSPYQIREFGTEEGLLPANATYSRDEGLRAVTECLGLTSACNKAMVFSEVTNVNQTEYKLVKGLREGGYTRPQEFDHMLTLGAEAYDKAVEEFGSKAPARTNYDEWLLEKQKELDESSAERKARVKAEYEEKKQKEIEDIAREWAKREYFRKATSGDMPYSEEEYINSVWERALFEGDLKYRMMNGQNTDERKELAEFKKKQEKKKALMLDRAKASLQGILDEEELVKIKTGNDDDEK
mmetsp:Transcript_28758/g.33044  ORF Transcript_28758/g.33044 Transcript_28758/m.33044 type:complete len:477 (-) Transcript_28758:214-1644(-)